MEAAGRNGSYSYVIGIPKYPATANYSSSFNVEQRPLPSAPPLSTQPTTPTTRQRRALATAFRNFLSFAMLAVTVVLMILIFGVTQRPKFGLSSLSVSKFNISGSEITAEWDVEFQVRNPNPVWRYWFDYPTVSVYYRDQLLSELEMFPQISVPRKKTKSYIGKTVALEKRIEDGEVAEAILRDWYEQGVVRFTIRLLQTDSLKVSCVDLEVGFSTRQEGKLMLQPPKNSNDSNHLLQEAFYRCSTYVNINIDNCRSLN